MTYERAATLWLKIIGGMVMLSVGSAALAVTVFVCRWAWGVIA